MSREADLLTEMGCNAGTLNASTCAEWYARQAESAADAAYWSNFWHIAGAEALTALQGVVLLGGAGLALLVLYLSGVATSERLPERYRRARALWVIGFPILLPTSIYLLYVLVSPLVGVSVLVLAILYVGWAVAAAVAAAEPTDPAKIEAARLALIAEMAETRERNKTQGAVLAVLIVVVLGFVAAMEYSA
jgi:hypothetical protein